MARGADDVEAAEFHDFPAILRRIAAEQNIGAAARHVGRDRHGSERSRLRDDFRFSLIVPRVQY